MGQSPSTSVAGFTGNREKWLRSDGGARVRRVPGMPKSCPRCGPFPAFLIPLTPLPGFPRSRNILATDRITLHLALGCHLGFKSRPDDDL